MADPRQLTRWCQNRSCAVPLKPGTHDKYCNRCAAILEAMAVHCVEP